MLLWPGLQYPSFTSEVFKFVRSWNMDPTGVILSSVAFVILVESTLCVREAWPTCSHKYDGLDGVIERITTVLSQPRRTEATTGRALSGEQGKELPELYHESSRVAIPESIRLLTVDQTCHPRDGNTQEVYTRFIRAPMLEERRTDTRDPRAVVLSFDWDTGACSIQAAYDAAQESVKEGLHLRDLRGLAMRASRCNIPPWHLWRIRNCRNTSALRNLRVFGGVFFLYPACMVVMNNYAITRGFFQGHESWFRSALQASRSPIQLEHPC